MAYYMPLHEILHACYMTPKTLEVLHVMACNLNVITCNYMHYMPLHAIEDANGRRDLSVLKSHFNPTLGSETRDISPY